jgi:nicotinamidase-related amidase
MEQSKTNTALLVMDMQLGILRNLTDATALITNVKKTITHAREKNIPVIYVVVGFRPGFPEVSPNNKSFSASKSRFANENMAEFMTVHPDIVPAVGEVTVIKRRFSAFTGSDLEVILRAYGAQHIVLTGISTSGVVLSTTREAADKDYRITILSDACADMDEEVHRVLTTKVFPRQADVISVEDWSK